jgi:hypothetical protein
MTEKDIVRLAIEAELWLHTDRKYEAVEKFAKLVAAEEREAIATEFMERHEAVKRLNNYWHHAANYVRERGQHD